MVALLAAAAGVAAIGAIAGTATQLSANKEAFKAQKKAAELELKNAKQRAKLEDRQFVQSIGMADRQLTDNFGLADRQAVKAIEIADGQQLARYREEERQTELAAAEDREAIKADLQTSNLNAAERALAIRRNLMSVLGEQRATLAARGVASGSLPGIFESEATDAADADFRANRINQLTAEADAARGVRSVDTGVSNLKSSNLLTARQSRELSLTSLGFDRAAFDQQLKTTRESAAAELKNARDATALELKHQKKTTKLGISAAKSQTRYANTAALISGFTQIASLGYSYASQRAAIEPTRQPTAYQAPRQLTRPQAQRAGF